MQLVRALLIAVSVVVLLSGISIYFGSSKQEKGSAARFLIAALGAVVWTIAILIFIHMPGASSNFIHIVVTCIIGGVTLCDIGLLAYLGWQYKHGKFATIFFTIIGIVLVALLAYDSSLFYSSVDTELEYTQLFVNHGWYYFALIAYFFLISIAFSGFLQKRIKATTNKGLKTGLKVFYIGLSIGGILALIFNLILITSHPHLVWIGPMATSISILSFYYSVVKFRTISMSSKWMEIMSYIILITTAIIIYLLAFYTVFSALYGTSNPAPNVLILNVIMAAFLLLLMPALTELTNFMKANFFVDKIELGYITKKLENIDRSSFDPKDIAKFLSDSMHYSYLILIINGRLYAPENLKITADQVEKIARLKPSTDTTWITSAELKTALAEDTDISRIGILKNKNGKEIGKVIFGKRASESNLTRKDVVKHEAIIGILATIAEEYSRK